MFVTTIAIVMLWTELGLHSLEDREFSDRIRAASSSDSVSLSDGILLAASAVSAGEPYRNIVWPEDRLLLEAIAAKVVWPTDSNPVTLKDELVHLEVISERKVSAWSLSVAFDLFLAASEAKNGRKQPFISSSALFPPDFSIGRDYQPQVEAWTYDEKLGGFLSKAWPWAIVDSKLKLQPLVIHPIPGMTLYTANEFVDYWWRLRTDTTPGLK